MNKVIIALFFMFYPTLCFGGAKFEKFKVEYDKIYYGDGVLDYVQVIGIGDFDYEKLAKGIEEFNYTFKDDSPIIKIYKHRGLYLTIFKENSKWSFDYSGGEKNMTLRLLYPRFIESEIQVIYDISNKEQK